MFCFVLQGVSDNNAEITPSSSFTVKFDILKYDNQGLKA